MKAPKLKAEEKMKDFSKSLSGSDLSCIKIQYRKELC